MSEPPIKSALESPELTGHAAPTQDRLNRCLASDASDVRPGTDGPHVVVIQNALKAVRIRQPDLGLPEIKDKAGTYGPDTTAAVRAYKAAKKIVRKGQALDPIVGRMTLTALDDDLLDRPPVEEISQDVLVHVLGARVGVPVEGQPELNGQPEVGVASVADFDRSVNTPDYLAKHKPLKHLQIHGGQGALNPTGRIVDFIAAHHDPKGFAIVIGLSSGGPVVAEVAKALAARPTPIALAYMAILDGAFDNAADRRRTDQIKGFRSDNFFQTLSNFAGQEFHGPVTSFTQNRDFSGESEFSDEQVNFNRRLAQTPFFLQNRLKQAFIEHVHAMAIRKAYPLAKAQAMSLLLP